MFCFFPWFMLLVSEDFYLNLSQNFISDLEIFCPSYLPYSFSKILKYIRKYWQQFQKKKKNIDYFWFVNLLSFNISYFIVQKLLPLHHSGLWSEEESGEILRWSFHRHDNLRRSTYSSFPHDATWTHRNAYVTNPRPWCNHRVIIIVILYPSATLLAISASSTLQHHVQQ